MALKPCRDCGEPVSYSSKKCPNCGVGSPTSSDFMRAIKSDANAPDEFAIGCVACVELTVLIVAVVIIIIVSFA